MDQDLKKDQKTPTEPFDVQAVNPRYRGAWMSDFALALVRPRDPKVAAIIEARRDEPEGI